MARALSLINPISRVGCNERTAHPSLSTPSSGSINHRMSSIASDRSRPHRDGGRVAPRPRVSSRARPAGHINPLRSTPSATRVRGRTAPSIATTSSPRLHRDRLAAASTAVPATSTEYSRDALGRRRRRVEIFRSDSFTSPDSTNQKEYSSGGWLTVGIQHA